MSDPKTNTLQWAFPVSTETLDKDGSVFTHKIEGGLTKREYVATAFAAAMFANPAMITVKDGASFIRRAAVTEADKFIEQLGAQT